MADKMAVVGGGTMGSGIAQTFAQSGYDTYLIDVEDRFVERALGRIEKSLNKFAEKGKISTDEKNAAFGRIHGGTEIAVAEGIGSQLFEDFDSVVFREVCNNLGDIPDLQTLSELLGNVLDEEPKPLILRYLKAIAEADGEIASEERDVLEQLSETLGILAVIFIIIKESKYFLAIV